MDTRTVRIGAFKMLKYYKINLFFQLHGIQIVFIKVNIYFCKLTRRNIRARQIEHEYIFQPKSSTNG